VISDPAGSNQWLNFLAAARLVFLDASMKSILWLAAVALVATALRRCSAALRHLLWLLAVLGLFALPVLSWTLPGWNLLPRWMVLPPASPARQSLPAAPEAAVPPHRPTSEPAGQSAPGPVAATAAAGGPAGTAHYQGPSGTPVQVVAIGRPASWPLRWWDTDGRVVPANPAWQ
jgi:hypothetical protein